jgi:PAS domain-containing protein
MPGIGEGMRRLRTSFDRLLRGDDDGRAGETDSADVITPPQWLGVCGLVAAAAILSCVALVTLSPREGLLFAIAAVLALIVCLLLMRHRRFNRTLAAERRQLRVAVNNIPQGLVLYDASARIIVCNQPYLDMFGLSPDVAKRGCTMRRLIEHRKEPARSTAMSRRSAPPSFAT